MSSSIALIGNFEENPPTQQQMRALQALVDDLADQYNINPRETITFHEKRIPTVTGHNELQATACPGYYVRETLSQVRRNVARNDIKRAIKFPKGAPRPVNAHTGIAWFSSTNRGNITPLGSTDLRGAPGSQQRITLLLTAGSQRISQRQRIASITRSDRSIGLWQDLGGSRELRLREELLAPSTVQAGGTAVIRLKVQMPAERGVATVKIGDVPYVLTTQGSSVSTKTSRKRTEENTERLVARNRVSRRSTRSSLLGLSARRSARQTARQSRTWQPTSSTNDIRIRLGYEAPDASVKIGRNTRVNDAISNRFRIDLKKEGNDCVAREYGKTLARGVVRITPPSGNVIIDSWAKSANEFRGTLECRIVDGQLTLINELPLEHYMIGLAEEPDTEPWHKQLAFAIAARSYAAYYLNPHTPKFAGKPYHGDDSPARFQMYGGVHFEESNPRWVQAVRETSNQVIKYNGQTLKIPYFSSSAGRTLSPDEVGWGTFPAKEVFVSNPDPYCEGMTQRGHGVGMSGCGSEGMANAGKTYEEILNYYFPGTVIAPFNGS